MLYSEIRPSIKSGDLLIWDIDRISNFNDFILYIYQKIFRTRYTHVGIALVVGGRVFCIEATPPVVRIMPLSNLTSFSILPCNIRWLRRYEYFLFKHIGKKYSLFDLINFLFNKKVTDKELYCSEMLANFYYDIGFVTTKEIGRTPFELVEYLKTKLNEEPIYIQMDKGNVK